MRGSLRRFILRVPLALAAMVYLLAVPLLARAAVCNPEEVGCPASGICTVTGTFDVASDCTLDFGDRDVVLEGTLRAEVVGGSFDVLAGSLHLMGGQLLLRGSAEDTGGYLYVVLSGAFAMSGNARIDVSAAAGAGTIEVEAASVSLAGGSIDAKGGSGDECGDGGTIIVAASPGDAVIGASLSATTPGYDCTGGGISIEGGSVTVSRDVSISGGNHSSNEILVVATAGDVTVASTATLSAIGVGNDGAGGGGTGGEIDLEAPGNVTVSGPLTATGAPGDGTGGRVEIEGGSIEIRRQIDVRGRGFSSGGGVVELKTKGLLTVLDDIVVSGGNDGYGGDVSLEAGTFVLESGAGVDARPALGTISVSAFEATIRGELDVRGAGGNDGGAIDVKACRVTIAGRLDASAGGGGTAGSNRLSGSSIDVASTGRVLATPCLPGDCNEFVLPLGAPSIAGGAVVDPPPTTITDPSLDVCCGNGVIDDGEECDDGGRLHCDGCTPSCALEAPDPCADDGNTCTGTTCIPEIGCEPLHGAACEDDGDPCTDDRCSGDSCTHTSPCNGNDDDPCRTGTCTAEGCVFDDMPDGTPCTSNDCTSTCQAGACVNPCEDGDSCTSDFCLGGGFCYHFDDQCPRSCEGQPNGLPCTDGLVCTTGQCVNETCVAETIACNPCQGQFCLEGLGCFLPVACLDDGNPCTADFCDPEAGGCVSEPLTGTTCPHDGNACTADVCDAGVCTHPTTGCDDGDACTADSCEADGTCGHETVSCDDGNACTTDSCHPASGCAHDPVSCDDGDPSTDDACDAAEGCTHTPITDLDAYACHRAVNTPRTHRFTPGDDVTAADALETITLGLRKPALVCAPASVDGDDPEALDEDDFIVGYLTRAAGAARWIRRERLAVTNALGTILIDVTARENLAVPTAVGLDGLPDPVEESDLDHFKCYKARPARGTPSFVPVRGVGTESRLADATVDLKKPTRLCLPASVNGEDPGAPEHPASLLCYQAKPSPGTPRPTRRSVHTSNQFGEDALDLPALREVCLPSGVELP